MICCASRHIEAHYLVPAKNSSSRARKLCPKRFVFEPEEAAAAGISECEGIDWEGHQLVDILLPALSAMDTYAADEGVFEVRWLRHDTARGRWYRALSAAMADVVVDAARLPWYGG